MAPLGSSSLRHRFSVALATMFVVTTVAASAAFWGTVTSLSVEYTRRFAVSQNELEKNRVLSLIDREVALGLKLVDDPVIQTWMADEADPRARRQAQDQLASYGRLFRDHSWFVAVAASGNYYVQRVPGAPVEVTHLSRETPSDRWFYSSLASAKPYWINVDYNPYLDKVNVWINVLVKDASGRALGVAGTGLNVGDFLTRLVDHPEPGLWSMIVDSRGEILAHPDRTLTDHNARVSRDADKIRVGRLFSSDADRARLEGLLAGAREGANAPVATLEYRGQSVVAVAGYLPGLEWYNLVLVDGNRVLSWTSFLPAALVFIAALAGFLALVRALLGRWVLGPLAVLNRASDAVAQGTWDVRVPAASTTELGRLGASFNAMAAKIQDHTENLSALVAARTRDLEASQARLVESIEYSKLLQGALRPAAADLALAGGHLLLLDPLDTVGGDFCFFRPIPGGFCAAAVDCTGHGVPGALMTMMVNALLNQVLQEGANDASAVLRRLDGLVQETLGAGDAPVQSGLDIGLCLVRPDLGWLEFAGAGLPLVVAGPGGVTEISGSRAHLGFSSRTKPLGSHRVALVPGARYYLLTDGLWDLPVEPRGFGLGRTGVLDLLASVQPLPWDDQAPALRSELARRRGPWAPKDDLLLFGFHLERRAP